MPGSEANADPAPSPRPPSTRRSAAWSRSSAGTDPRSSSPTARTRPGYPHPDHLRVHEISVLAFDAAGDPDRFPDAGPPFAPSKLYYSVWSGARIRQIHDKFVELGLESPFDEKWLKRIERDEKFTTTIDIDGFTDVRGGGAARPRHPGRPQLAVLVRPAARGDAGHPPDRGVPARPQPHRPDGRDRGRPLRGTAHLSSAQGARIRLFGLPVPICRVTQYRGTVHRTRRAPRLIPPASSRRSLGRVPCPRPERSGRVIPPSHGMGPLRS